MSLDQATNNELQRALGRIEGQLTGLDMSIKASLAAHKEDYAALNLRLNKVENRQYWFSGLAAAAGFVAAKLTAIWHG